MKKKGPGRFTNLLYLPDELPDFGPFFNALTGKRQDFVLEYVHDLNAKDAAARSDMSYGVARQILMKPEVRQAIAEVRAWIVAQGAKSAVDVIHELEHIAFSNLRDYMKIRPPMLIGTEIDEETGDEVDLYTDEEIQADLENVSYEKWAAVKEINFDPRSGRAKITMHSKLDALMALMRHHGLFEKDNTQAKDADTADAARQKIRDGLAGRTSDSGPARDPDKLN